MQWLKQNTAITLKIGPFVDEDDGKTAETGLTISQADVRLSKNGGNMAQKNEASACTHDELGDYDCPIDATDTNTLGRLRLHVHESGALPVWRNFMIVPANVWDSFFGADALQVDTIQIEGVDATNQIRDAVVDDATRIDASTLNTLSGFAPGSTIAAASDIPAMRGTDNAALAATALSTAVWTAARAGALGDWINDGRLDVILDAILADTGTDGVAISTAVRQGIADEVLKRGVDNVEDAADVLSLAAVILATLESAISGTTWTIRKSGGTTFATKTVTVDADADPIVGVT